MICIEGRPVGGCACCLLTGSGFTQGEGLSFSLSLPCWLSLRYSWLLGWGMISVFTLYVLLTNVTALWLRDGGLGRSVRMICVKAPGTLARGVSMRMVMFLLFSLGGLGRRHCSYCGGGRGMTCLWHRTQLNQYTLGQECYNWNRPGLDHAN